MSIIKQDQKRLDNIAKAYWNTSGEMREMWGRKWYELIKIIGRKLDESSNERSAADTRQNSLTEIKVLLYLIVLFIWKMIKEGLNEIGKIELQQSKLIGKA